jgi:hypothetical protein
MNGRPGVLKHGEVQRTMDLVAKTIDWTLVKRVTDRR